MADTRERETDKEDPYPETSRKLSSYRCWSLPLRASTVAMPQALEWLICNLNVQPIFYGPSKIFVEIALNLSWQTINSEAEINKNTETLPPFV